MVQENTVNIRPRISDMGIKIGLLPHGRYNTITDVEGVTVGHVTLTKGCGPLDVGIGPIRTGVTVIIPHQRNTFKDKVTAAIHVINGFGKSIGLAQIQELGVIESPIALTNTLNCWLVADALSDYMSGHNEGSYSFNPVVGECNDSYLNDILGKHVGKTHVNKALDIAYRPNIEEGSIGAGTGMTGFGWKGGIGTSSRLCNSPKGSYTVGAMTLTNTGDPREFRIDGIQIGRKLLPEGTIKESGGSIMIIVGTDAPVTARQLGRMARRSALGLGRVGAIASHGSGDFVIAFSNSTVRTEIDDAHLTPLFRGVVEATEEAIINSILRSHTIEGRDSNIRHGIPIDRLKEVLSDYIK